MSAGGGNVPEIVTFKLLFLQKPAYTINTQLYLNGLTDRLRGTVNYA